MNIETKPFKSFYIPSVRFVGTTSKHPWYGTKDVLAMGRTESEARILSKNLLEGKKPWRVQEIIDDESRRIGMNDFVNKDYKLNMGKEKAAEVGESNSTDLLSESVNRLAMAITNDIPWEHECYTQTDGRSSKFKFDVDCQIIAIHFIRSR